MQIIIGYIVAGLCFLGTIYGGYLVTDGLAKKTKTAEEEKNISEFTPQVYVTIFPEPPQAISPYKYPLKRYHLMVGNKNRESAPIKDIRISFYFSNIVEIVKKKPLLIAESGVSVSGVEIYSEREDGSLSKYEEGDDSGNLLAEDFDVTIRQDNFNDNKINTNELVFSCEKWPELVDFGAEIILNLSKTPQVYKYPQKVGSFEGRYFYEINGKRLSKEIRGIIPQVK